MSLHKFPNLTLDCGAHPSFRINFHYKEQPVATSKLHSAQKSSTPLSTVSTDNILIWPTNLFIFFSELLTHPPSLPSILFQ